jgi:putative SOS response-associated peptidase YedK
MNLATPVGEAVPAWPDWNRSPRVLRAALSGSALTSLCRICSAEPMTMWPISARMNSPKNDDPELLDRIELEDA